ncbi:MAG: 6-carboxytetrahydropterin synthase QueD [Candidatus Aminicenantes bacterium]
MSWILKVRDKFQAAHFLKGYQGKCERIHGHTFKVEVEILVKQLDKSGIGIDFTKIKKTLSQILPDHSLLNDIYPFNPSAENLARRFFQELKSRYPVIRVTVWESDDASATYFEDQ